MSCSGTTKLETSSVTGWLRVMLKVVPVAMVVPLCSLYDHGVEAFYSCEGVAVSVAAEEHAGY
jgi:hypothetical protein